ncbi:hypothetical protein V7O61_14205 [Methanolobus sp. WCC1]|jgi:hypothetical protein|uniref:Uncharacterized protein n=1 Tax=Methanolobus tindarius DSM 2278 TaxID=1090322 RepID=W9DXP6_METTI|nr:hypothetical protein [Methanolobus tindarius]ETA68186.1 hypothetical protein MettiDRAFT_1639 [Methanolobus tindarius DSM 2278]
MTRITENMHRISLSTSEDIFNMKNQRDPESNELWPFLVVHANHATINKEVVVYDDEGVYQVYTKKVMSELEKLQDNK